MRHPNLPSNYIELVTKYLPRQLKSLSITLANIDMYDWIEQVGWGNTLKLTKHTRSIPNVSINFRANGGYKESLPRDESRMTQFYKLLGVVTVNLPNLYHSIQASDLSSSYATI